MTNKILITLILSLLMATSPILASENHGTHDEKTGAQKPVTFKHETVVDGIQAEFQIMSLSSMNMKDPDGATYHVMLKLFNKKTNQPIKQVVGKVKVIDPAGEEQIATLKDYNGILAANFTFKETGKYGMICLFKENGKKHVVKFWYPHQ